MNPLPYLLIAVAKAQELIPCPDGTLADPTIGCVAIPGNVVNPQSSLLALLLKGANGLMSLSAGIAIVFLILGAIRYATAAGNDEQINQAKRMLFWSIFGLILSLLAIFVVQFILGITK